MINLSPEETKIQDRLKDILNQTKEKETQQFLFTQLELLTDHPSLISEFLEKNDISFKDVKSNKTTFVIATVKELLSKSHNILLTGHYKSYLDLLRNLLQDSLSNVVQTDDSLYIGENFVKFKESSSLCDLVNTISIHDVILLEDCLGADQLTDIMKPLIQPKSEFSTLPLNIEIVSVVNSFVEQAVRNMDTYNK